MTRTHPHARAPKHTAIHTLLRQEQEVPGNAEAPSPSSLHRRWQHLGEGGGASLTHLSASSPASPWPASHQACQLSSPNSAAIPPLQSPSACSRTNASLPPRCPLPQSCPPPRLFPQQPPGPNTCPQQASSCLRTFAPAAPSTQTSSSPPPFFYPISSCIPSDLEINIHAPPHAHQAGLGLCVTSCHGNFIS